jgi:branched-chain amino acid transport system ATP-binding protein
MTAFLKIANIQTHYSDRIHALHGLSLEIIEGEISVILGPNGAGKTTLLKTIAGLLKDQPQKGSIAFNGRPIQRLPPERISVLGICYVPEDPGPFREFTVGEHLELGCWGRSDLAIEVDMRYVDELFPILKEKRSRQAETLSGDERRILGIAKAYLSKPKLLMLDEPFLGLVPSIACKVRDALVKINKLGTSILLAEQNARLALRIAHYAYILEAGRIVLKGTARELMENPNVPGISEPLSEA